MNAIVLSIIYQKYGEENINNWCRKLQHFRLQLSHPYPDDLLPDRFTTIISFNSEDKLEKIVSELKISLELPNSVLSAFKEYNENHSAGWVMLNEILCTLDINKIRKTITIDVSGVGGDLFSLGEETFNRALKIDKFLSNKNFNFIDPPEDDARYCIAPKFYPEVWGKK